MNGKLLEVPLALPNSPWYNNQTVESSVASRALSRISRSESGILVSAGKTHKVNLRNLASATRLSFGDKAPRRVR